MFIFVCIASVTWFHHSTGHSLRNNSLKIFSTIMIGGFVFTFFKFHYSKISYQLRFPRLGRVVRRADLPGSTLRILAGIAGPQPKLFGISYSPSWRSRNDFFQIIWRTGTIETFFNFKKVDNITHVHLRLACFFWLLSPLFWPGIFITMLPFIMKLLQHVGFVFCLDIETLTISLFSWSIWASLYYNWLSWRMHESLFRSIPSIDAGILKMHGVSEFKPLQYESTLISHYFTGKTLFFINLIIWAIVPTILTVFPIFLDR